VPNLDHKAWEIDTNRPSDEPSGVMGEIKKASEKIGGFELPLWTKAVTVAKDFPLIQLDISMVHV